MAIHRLLKNIACDPAQIGVMVEAYEWACRELNLAGTRFDPLTELLVLKIVELAQVQAEPDAKRICAESLRDLGILSH